MEWKETDSDLRWLKEAIDPILDRIMEYSTERWLYAEDNFEGVWNSVENIELRIKKIEEALVDISGDVRKLRRYCDEDFKKAIGEENEQR